MKMKSLLPSSVRPVVGFGVCLMGALVTAAPAHALSFNFIPASGTSQQAINGFAAAGTRWSSLFTDNVTINLNIGFTALGAGILGSTSSVNYTTTYSSIKTQLSLDRKSAADFTAVASLQAGSSFAKLVNESLEHPVATLENDGSLNNTRVFATGANLKALGYTGLGASDGSISFSTSFAWDFDPTNGITANTFDFVGIASHEIGHALGFISRVDSVDAINLSNPFTTENASSYYSTTLDLFRYSNFNGTIVNDFTAGSPTRDRYFSIDGGQTNLGSFSLGVSQGDGRQASHWKDNLGLGIMDPTAGYGEALQITALDIAAFDAIGWDVRVPETASYGTFGIMALTMLGIFGVARKTP